MNACHKQKYPQSHRPHCGRKYGLVCEASLPKFLDETVVSIRSSSRDPYPFTRVVNCLQNVCMMLNMVVTR